MFRRRDFLKTLGLFALAPYACTSEPEGIVEPPDDEPPGDEPPDDGPPDGGAAGLAVSSDDPHYLTLNDEPKFMLGFGHPLDWYHPTRYNDLKAAYIERGLSYARVLLPWAAPAADVVAYTHQRTGPGNALDGGLKFDLTQIDTAFLDRLEDMVSWARNNSIIVSVGLWHDWPFETTSFGVTTDYNWQGSVVNPANRINTEADELVVHAPSSSPDFFEILDAGAAWDSEADRTWLRDRVKEVFDAVLDRLASYDNWYIEGGSRSYFGRTPKEYWLHYCRGESHAIDDGDVSPSAIADTLWADQPGEPVDSNVTGETGVAIAVLPEVGEQAGPVGNANTVFTEVQSFVENGQQIQEIFYDESLVMLATSEGYFGADTRQNRRRSAAMTLVGCAGYEAMIEHDGTEPRPPSSADFLPDFQRLMSFVHSDRDGISIEQARLQMQPHNDRVNVGYALEYKPGETERYVVFAVAGQNPLLSVDSAGLDVLRFDMITGAEDTDPASPTVSGANQLTGTGNDTIWFVSGSPVPPL